MVPQDPRRELPTNLKEFGLSDADAVVAEDFECGSFPEVGGLRDPRRLWRVLPALDNVDEVELRLSISSRSGSSASTVAECVVAPSNDDSVV